jgi:hypothetical protein
MTWARARAGNTGTGTAARTAQAQAGANLPPKYSSTFLVVAPR